MSETPSKAKRRSWVGEIVDLTLRCLLVFLVMEGVASLWVVSKNIYLETQEYIANGYGFQFDSELGWISSPSHQVIDAFGPGHSVFINSQQLRAKRDYTKKIPAGMTRILCVGDSFTWGSGVDNDLTWVQQMQSIDSGLEMINLGQNGYGIDQAFLRYRRDGTEFDHQVVLFSMVGSDFVRMRLTTFLGMPKPKLAVVDGKIEIANAPLPEPSLHRIWAWRATSHVMGLELLQVLTNAGFGHRGSRHDPLRGVAGDIALQRITAHILKELAAIAAEQSAQLVVLYLPRFPDYEPDSGWDELRTQFQDELKRQEILSIDLVPPFRKLPPSTAKRMFILDAHKTYRGHYSAAGNSYFAWLIYRELCGLPEVAGTLNSCESAISDRVRVPQFNAPEHPLN